MTTWPLTQHLTAQLRQVLTTCLIGGVGLGAFATLASLSGCGDSSKKVASPVTATNVSPVTNSDGKKVVRFILEVGESGFDPATVHDLYTSVLVDGVFDTILTYDYLAEPAKLVPKLATEMPLVEDGGKLYTVKLHKGVFFSPHDAFGGKKRELTATDIAYSFKRHFDDTIKPVWRFLIDGKIVGLNAWYDAGKKAGKLDWDAPVEGLEIVDPYTIRFHLTRPDHNFGYVLAHVATGVVAREVIEKYPDDAQSHPIGSSAYYMKEWVRGQKIIFERNPYWRGGVWDFKASGQDPYDEEIVKAMKGKPLAVIDRVEFYPIEEAQTQTLAFNDSQIDVLHLLSESAPQYLEKAKLKSEYTARGMRLQRFPDPEYTYSYFQWNDPIWGGAELAKIALRRAVAMSIDREEEIDVIRKGQAVKADYLVPIGVVGYKKDFASSITYNPALANALLDKFGYKKGSDGFRMTPDGKPLVWKYTSRPLERDRQFDELYTKSATKIGIRYEAEKEKFADSLKREKRCQIASRGGAWIADYPDGDNFVQLLYSKNIGESNAACYKSAAFDKLYETSASLPNGPERDKLYFEMQKQFEADTPWAMGVSRLRNQLMQPWVVGYKKHPILLAEWMYFDVNMANSGKGK